MVELRAQFAFVDLVGQPHRLLAVDQREGDLDIAMQGDALLVVQAKDGEEAYTRRGDLQVSPSGLLTTGDGSPVQGTQGPVTIPPADAINIDQADRIANAEPAGDGRSGRSGCGICSHGPMTGDQLPGAADISSA